MTRVRVAIVLLAVLAGAALAQEAPSTDKVLLGGPNAVPRCGFRAQLGERSGEGQAGQTEWDVRYYTIDATVDFAALQLDGTVTAYVTPVAAVDSLVLDALDTLTPSAVRVDGSPALWRRLDDATLSIATPGATVGVESVVEVDYVALPNQTDFGAFWFPEYQDDDGNRFRSCQTMTETQNAGAWWPCIDRLTHKPDSLALAITVPDSMVVASNGVLEGIDASAGMRTYRWRERHPIATYLVSITIAPFVAAGDGTPWTESYDLGGGATMPLQWFIRPHHEDEAQRNLPLISDMLDAFRGHFGEYPFEDEKYGVAEFSFGGGMEHQTISSIGSASIASGDSANYVQPHELAHQWFGDRISPATWEDIWLNEGFATYAEALYYEHLGRYAAGEYLFRYRRLPSDILFSGTIVDPEYTFNTTVYWKGAWVLHMLRQRMGDAAFFTLLQDWAASDPPGGIAGTQDFIDAAKAHSAPAEGSALDQFFQRWLYGTGRPVYAWAWDAANVGGEWELSVELQQVQGGELFSDSLDLQVGFASGDPIVQRVAPSEAINRYTWTFATEPTDLTLDPDHRLLHNAIPGPALDAPLALLDPYPNPFSGSFGTSISLALRRSGPLTVEVVDVLGRRVESLFDGHHEAGALNVDWRGRDDDGALQAGGVYFLRVRLGDYSETRKLVFLAGD
ncbi:MAG: M1 family aminopeptidase [Candidatus Krumholzibacteriia bacterium]